MNIHQAEQEEHEASRDHIMERFAGTSESSCCWMHEESDGEAHDADCRLPLGEVAWWQRADARRAWLAKQQRKF